MLSVAVLGARCSGKTTLAKACLKATVRDNSSSSSAFCRLHSDTCPNIDILDPNRGSGIGDLARELARRTVLASLITLPRDTTNTHASRMEALEWCNMARAHCYRPRIALVVTKMSVKTPLVDECRFDQNALETMRVTGVEKIFYTDALKEGASGVRAWLLDLLQESKSATSTSTRRCVPFELGDWNSRNRYVQVEESGGRAKKSSDQQRTCDACRLC